MMQEIQIVAGDLILNFLLTKSFMVKKLLFRKDASGSLRTRPAQKVMNSRLFFGGHNMNEHE